MRQQQDVLVLSITDLEQDFVVRASIEQHMHAVELIELGSIHEGGFAVLRRGGWGYKV